ncbi:hypothetical protein KEM55_008998 [Ascosphaera atra]|nr:hypothetical protein KEM55_008998 [Ascosphaera atra]
MQDAQQEAATEDNSTAASVQGIEDDDSELSELEKSPEPPGSEPSLSDVEEQTTPTQGGTFIYRPIASADGDDDLGQGHGERSSPTPVEARVEDMHPSSDTDML